MSTKTRLKKLEDEAALLNPQKTFGTIEDFYQAVNSTSGCPILDAHYEDVQ